MPDIVLAESALEHLTYWSKQDPRTLRRIFDLLQAIQKEPFSGVGKPEPLKHELSGYWSRRIDDTHRIVYSVSEKQDNGYFMQVSLLTDERRKWQHRFEPCCLRK